MGIIRNLIRRTEPASIPEGMLDLHCHILPGIDDGPEGMKESIVMAEIAVEDGITDIIATPHLNADRYDFSEVVSLVDFLNQVLSSKNIPLVVHPGCEVSVIFDPVQVAAYTLNAGNTLLLEFCHAHLPVNSQQVVRRYVDAGFQVILAHPERNPSVLRQPEVLDSLLGKHVYVQVTAGSLTGNFGADIQRCALYLLKERKIDFLATDAHSSTHRKPILSSAFRVAEKHIGYSEAVKLVKETPRSILHIPG